MQSGHEAIINQILQDKPLHPPVEKEMQSYLTQSIASNYASLSAFCLLTPCQLMQIDLEKTAQKLKQLKSPDQQMLEAVCSCNLLTESEFFSRAAVDATTLGAGVLALGCFSPHLRPACIAAEALATPLAAASGANALSAYQSSKYYLPLRTMARDLPGLAEEKKNEIHGRAQKEDRWLIGDAMGTAIPALLKSISPSPKKVIGQIKTPPPPTKAQVEKAPAPKAPAENATTQKLLPPPPSISVFETHKAAFTPLEAVEVGQKYKLVFHARDIEPSVTNSINRTGIIVVDKQGSILIRYVDSPSPNVNASNALVEVVNAASRKEALAPLVQEVIPKGLYKIKKEDFLPFLKSMCKTWVIVGAPDLCAK